MNSSADEKACDVAVPHLIATVGALTVGLFDGSISSFTPLPCMNSLMLGKVRATNEGFPTLLTLIGLLPSMDFQVSTKF